MSSIYIHRGYRARRPMTNGIRVLLLEHVEVATKAYGKPLPAGAVVHHHDENKQNNAPTNLVICPNESYHIMLHRRMRAYDACGHADWRKCQFCKQYDDPSRLVVRRSTSARNYIQTVFQHEKCRQEYARAYHLKRKSA